MQHKKTNWWAIIAILIIGIPVGYVAMGIVKNMANKDEVAMVEPKNEVKKDSVNMTNPTDKEKEETVDRDLSQKIESDVETGDKTETVQDKQQEVVRPSKTIEKVDEGKTPPQPAPKKLSVSVKPNSLAYAANGGSKTINITGNTDWSVTITEGDEWLRANTTDGVGNKTVTLVAQENRVTSSRHASIVVRWKDQNDEEHTYSIRASQAEYVPIPEPITVAEAQAIIAAGRTDSRIPDNCKVVGNSVNTNYKQFRTNVVEKKYESVNVESVSHDKKGNASQVKVTVVRLQKTTHVSPEPTPAPKPTVSKDEVQGIVAKGQPSSKVPDGCTVVVNGKPTNYLNFRNGIVLGAYSGVSVTSVELNGNGTAATRINIKAKVKRADD